ncbi:hypothetical protein HU200_017281 [Digitaria exilis]|uniref:Uncharacterized protein n=1 Tax=Digitaria exilis TaxID=1010633 RepID=A0A835F7A4_9POAL|nr:hypothetical protein HU200_017281 [Digitaria exilis]
MARTPRGAHKVVAAICSGELGGGEKEWRWRGWRAPARAEVVVVVGCVATLTLLVLVFGGGTGSLTAFSSPRIELVKKPAD